MPLPLVGSPGPEGGGCLNATGRAAIAVAGLQLSLGTAFARDPKARPEQGKEGCQPVVLGPALGVLAPTVYRQVWCCMGALPVLTSTCALQRVVLSFEFPFYGHPLRQITIATGGKSGSAGPEGGLRDLGLSSLGTGTN